MNYLLILTDQMQKYAWNGENNKVITPNLNRLAFEGTTFENGYSTCPICVPYRKSLWTGQYLSQFELDDAFENYGYIPEKAKTMAGILNEKGYETSFVGKYHLGQKQPIEEDIRAGFKHFLGYQIYNGYLDNIVFYNEENKEIKYEGHRTDITTQLGIERLQMLANKDKPFLHVVFYQAPHYPEQPSQKWLELYNDTKFEMPENYKPIDPYTPTYCPYSPRPYEKCPDYEAYHNDIQSYLQHYYGMVSQIDDGVGRILDEVENLGLANDTIILFSSDHGDMQGSHGFKNKSLPYEESACVPFIVRYPDGARNFKSSKPVSTVDILPTILDVEGYEKESNMLGISFCSQIKNGDSYNENTYIVSEFSIGKIEWVMIRDSQFKLICTQRGEPIYLFDIENDKHEMNNLINDKKHTTQKEVLYRYYMDWRRKLSDSAWNFQWV